ncbi:hypothetical protein [Bacteroides nordii]|uniref:hypothetical protein n=1 Tax=Bacteroides nordii TaxID=291645 RepID=UPI00352199F0
MWYDFDIIKYAQYVLPPVLRKKKVFALISVFQLSLIFIYSSFKKYRKQSIDKQNINGQVIYIEKALNDRFYLKNREIFITDIEDSVTYLHKRTEGQIPIYIYKRSEKGKTVLKYRDEGSYEGNFIVHIPSFLKEYETDIRNQVNYYKPAGRSFKIEIYDYE